MAFDETRRATVDFVRQGLIRPSASRAMGKHNSLATGSAMLAVVAPTLGQQRPGNACVFVGQGHCHDVLVPPPTNGANDPNNSILPANTDRGFTDHEMLDEIGLVHMNGRVYDPLVGRFLSADPYIQSPLNLQSYNRYSYVMNNPLGSADPSGYFGLKSFFKAATHLTLANTLFSQAPGALETTAYMVYASYQYISNQPGQTYIDNYVMNNSWAYSVGMVAATASTSWICYGCGGAAFASYYSYQATGSVAKAYKVGAITFATNYAFSVVGSMGTSYGWGTLQYVAAHAAVGCASAAASGGNCGQGAAAAGFGTLATQYVPITYKGNYAYEVTYMSAVGGTASVLGGGKFANGAKSAAFVYLLKAAPSMYEDFVDYGLDMGPGGDAVEKGPLDPPVKGANNVGVQNCKDPRNSWFCEGGTVSRFFNQVFGVNAVAGVHDTMQNGLGTGLMRDIGNVPLMLPAAAFTYGAAFGQVLNSLPSPMYIYRPQQKDANGRSEYRPPIMVW